MSEKRLAELEIARLKAKIKKDKVDHEDGFITSAVVGYATDSALLGVLVGGDITGAILGDLFNDED
jgi:hypothetical protein